MEEKFVNGRSFHTREESVKVDSREQMPYPDVVIYTHNCLLLLWSPFHVIHNYIATVLSVRQFKSSLTKPGRGVPASQVSSLIGQAPVTFGVCSVYCNNVCKTRGIFPSPSRTAASILRHSCCTAGTVLSTSQAANVPPESLWP